MKGLFFGVTFWSLYTLGFTVVLPTVLYYNTVGTDASSSPQESAGMAFFYLGLGVLIWLTVILLYSRFFIRMVFTDKQQLEKATKDGVAIVARIIGKKQVGILDNCPLLELTLAFNNLSGYEVETRYQLNDGKPLENRFEIGNTIEMRASLNGKNAAFVPKTMQVMRDKGVVLRYSFIFILLLLAAIVYPVFSYKLESQGAGWRFLTFYHPWIMVPAINIAVGAFIWLIFGFIRKTWGNAEEPLRMLLYGIRTIGNILNYHQTGVYINEQPQVQFEVEYADQQGIKRIAILKKIVSLLGIHKISTGPVEIMYLPTQPQTIIFYEDLSL